MSGKGICTFLGFSIRIYVIVSYMMLNLATQCEMLTIFPVNIVALCLSTEYKSPALRISFFLKS